MTAAMLPNIAVMALALLAISGWCAVAGELRRQHPASWQSWLAWSLAAMSGALVVAVRLLGGCAP
jgi:hypothetical protein